MSFVLGLEIPVLCLERVCSRKGCPLPWPRIFFVLGLGLEPCVLDSTSGANYYNCIQDVSYQGLHSLTINISISLKVKSQHEFVQSAGQMQSKLKFYYSKTRLRLLAIIILSVKIIIIIRVGVLEDTF